MDWIKKNYDQFLLALFAVVLIGVSVKLILDTSGFGERYAEALSNPPPDNRIPKVDTQVIDQARQQLDKPTIWNSRGVERNGGLLFTSDKYTVKDGQLKKTIDDAQVQHSLTRQFIPNKWFLDNEFSLAADSGTQDPDGDGFLNEDEWLHNTDPKSKESHPPYHVLLFLKEWVRDPFRLVLKAYDSDPKTTPPEQQTVQVNTLDLSTPSQFLKLGETVAGSKFKLTKFEFKEAINPGTGDNEDASELTLTNAETGDTVVLVLNKVTNSPNQKGKFEYRWNKKATEPGQEILVPRLKEFVLHPQTDKRYKLLDVKETEALIQTPDGPKYTVPKLPGGAPK